MVLSSLPPVLLNVPFEQYVQSNIFDRLGMTSTTYSYDIAKLTGRLANGFGREGVNKSENLFGKGITRPMPYWNQAAGDSGHCMSQYFQYLCLSYVLDFSGAGGALTSAEDIVSTLLWILLNVSNSFDRPFG